MAKVINNTYVVTNKARINYAHLLEPVPSMNGGNPFYSCCVVIPKEDVETINAINSAIDAAYKAGGDKWGGRAPSKNSLHTPLRDGDEDRPDDPSYANCYFINCKSKNKPRIVDKDKQDIYDPDAIYSGMYANVVMNFYAYANNGNRGIAAGLGDLQKVADGERLGGGRPTADSMFTVLSGEELPF